MVKTLVVLSAIVAFSGPISGDSSDIHTVSENEGVKIAQLDCRNPKTAWEAWICYIR